MIVLTLRVSQTHTWSMPSQCNRRNERAHLHCLWLLCFNRLILVMTIKFVFFGQKRTFSASTVVLTDCAFQWLMWKKCSSSLRCDYNPKKKEKGTVLLIRIVIRFALRTSPEAEPSNANARWVSLVLQFNFCRVWTVFTFLLYFRCIYYYLLSFQRLVVLEKRWILPEPGCSLYLRPVAIGTEPCVSAKGNLMNEPNICFLQLLYHHHSAYYLRLLVASREMRIYCICCPVGSYFPNGNADTTFSCLVACSLGICSN